MKKFNTRRRKNLFTKDNPDKGTETCSPIYLGYTPTLSFTKDNPDKGTETNAVLPLNIKILLRLQKITPIRGRKLKPIITMRKMGIKVYKR